MSDLLAEAQVHRLPVAADAVRQACLGPVPTQGAGTQLARAPFWREEPVYFHSQLSAVLF